MELQGLGLAKVVLGKLPGHVGNERRSRLGEQGGVSGGEARTTDAVVAGDGADNLHLQRVVAIDLLNGVRQFYAVEVQDATAPGELVLDRIGGDVVGAQRREPGGVVDGGLLLIGV